MTNEELVALIQAGENVEDNISKLYKRVERLIAKMALPYADQLEVDDAKQEAYFALVEAIKEFNPLLGYKFNTIFSRILKNTFNRLWCKRRYSRLTSMTHHELSLISKYVKFKNCYLKEHDSNPGSKEIMDALNITESKLKKLEQHIQESTCDSLDVPIVENENLNLGDSIADDKNNISDLIDSLSIEKAKGDIWEAVDSLPERERKIIIRRYKDGAGCELISDDWGRSHQWIRDIEKHGLDLLREDQKIKEAAEVYGCNSMYAYHYGLQRFENTGSSSTEYLAIKYVELEDRISALTKKIGVVAIWGENAPVMKS